MGDPRYYSGRLLGERFQAALGGKPVTIPKSVAAAVGGVGAQLAKVTSVNYAESSVEVSSGQGTNTAFVLKAKSSRKVASAIDMPNVGDLGLVICINGDPKSGVWLGSINTIETDENAESDKSFFPSVSDLIHALFRKHETGSYWLLNKLGRLTGLINRKASKESDPAKKHVNIAIGNDGKVMLTHYRGDDKKGSEFSLSENGEFSFDVLKDDGSTVVHSFRGSVASGSETFKYENKTAGSSIEAKADGGIDIIDGLGNKMTLEISDASANLVSALGGSIKVTDSIAVEALGGNGLTVDAAKTTLKAATVNLEGGVIKLGTIGFLPFMTLSSLTLLNAIIVLVKSHEHVVTGTLPPGPGPAVAAPSLILAPVSPIPVTPPNITVQTVGG